MWSWLPGTATELTRSVPSPPFAPIQQVYAKKTSGKRISARMDVVGLLIGPLGICLMLVTIILMYLAVNPTLAAALGEQVGIKCPKRCRRRKKRGGQKSPDDVQEFDEEEDEEESDDGGGGCCARKEAKKSRITLNATVLKDQEELKEKQQRSTMWTGQRQPGHRKTAMSFGSLFTKKAPSPKGTPKGSPKETPKGSPASSR
jgi:hypothetical protein